MSVGCELARARPELYSFIWQRSDTWIGVQKPQKARNQLRGHYNISGQTEAVLNKGGWLRLGKKGTLLRDDAWLE